MWVSGRSGAPWKAFQGLENTEEKGGKCFREGPAKTLQNKGEKMPRGSPENPVKNMIYWTVCGPHGIIEKGKIGEDSYG